MYVAVWAAAKDITSHPKHTQHTGFLTPERAVRGRVDCHKLIITNFIPCFDNGRSFVSASIYTWLCVCSATFE
jgi:hypothetical protein